MKKYNFTINDVEYAVEVKNIEDKTLEVNVNGAYYVVELDKVAPTIAPPPVAPQPVAPSAPPPPVAPPPVAAAPVATPPTAANAVKIKSPLPGTIRGIFVKKGDTVAVGQKVLLLEAMKMENEIASEKAGVVTEIKVAENDTVMEGDVLLVIG